MHPDLGPQAVLPSAQRWPLHDAATSRQLEAEALASSAPQAMMQAAGLAVARLALAVSPSARRIWVAAGPGNNGGDGLVVARLLQQRGWAVQVALLGDAARLPADATWALAAAREAGVSIEPGLPAKPPSVDLVVDALLGLGTNRAPDGAIAQAIAEINQQHCSVLSVDLPSGLCGDRGTVLGAEAVRATHTLSLLSLKPGLFTAQGRDHAGRVWLDRLGVAPSRATAWLAGPPAAQRRLHAQHKGSFGDVLVLGGASGMGGAAQLAARAALCSGAGRVHLTRLSAGPLDADQHRPELMSRTLAEALQPEFLARTTAVCGCGGGSEVAKVLPTVLHHARCLVLDADALNAIAADAALRRSLRGRADRCLPTIITPHPLEAARLLSLPSAAIQSDRLLHAQSLADQLACHVVLKGSGTVLASPGALPSINPTGNGRLGTAGTGDVLAGWLGGRWAAGQPGDAHAAALESIWIHGRAADDAPLDQALLAGDLIAAMQAVTSRA